MTRSRLSLPYVVCAELIAACAQVPAGPGARSDDWGRLGPRPAVAELPRRPYSVQLTPSS